MPTSEEAAATAAAEAIAAGDEAQETASGSETETETEAVAFPSFDVDLPADLAALLEEEETDLSVSDDELDSLAEEHEDVPREVLARMRAAEKKAEHLEKLRVNEAKKNWAEEAKQYFPLSEPFLSEINATSKRGFLRTAKEVHSKMVPIMEEKVLAPARAAIEAEKEKAKGEGKAEAKAAWGQPLANNDPPSEAGVTLARTQERRHRAELSDTIRGMLFPKGATE